MDYSNIARIKSTWCTHGNVTSAGWQVTPCDPMWHVSSRSGVATLRTAIHLLLTYTSDNSGVATAVPNLPVPQIMDHSSIARIRFIPVVNVNGRQATVQQLHRQNPQ